MIILTGDRPTGPLHLGHFIGSLQNRVALQKENDMYIMLADTQALTDNFHEPSLIKKNIFQITEDYLACGLDPSFCCIFIQSCLPALPELTLYFMNLVTISRLGRNPTVKSEIQQKNFDESLPAGFFCYPISQAADITAFKATCVPVGEDQLPMIEQTNEITRKFNRIYQTNCLKEAQALLGNTPRLIGIDGNHKATKSLGNAIFLNDSEEVVKEKIMSMYTDPNHIKVTDPGNVECNVVFHYLDSFDPEKEELEDLKKQYRKGGLGDISLKKRLIKIMHDFFEPIREKRASIKTSEIKDILQAGNNRAKKITDQTLTEVKEAMGIIY